MTIVVPDGGRLPPRARARLVVEILIAYAQVRLQLRRTDVRGTLTALRSGPSAPSTTVDAARTGRSLGRAVVRTLSLLPTDSRCLMRSLVLSRMLWRRGIDARIVIAVTGGADFRAHAWVEHCGRALLAPGGPEFERLAEL